MNARGLLIAALCLIPLTQAPRLLGTEKKEHPLQGTWQAISADNGGEVEPKENLEKARLTIAGDKIKFRDGEFDIEGTIQVDESKAPKTFDASFPDESGKVHRVLGIYKLEGDVLTMCFDVESETRPTEFTTTPKSRTLIVWQRVRP
jgi:uncharacterized protein (TIGR03067 family)